MTTTIASLVANHLDLWTSATQRKSGAGRGGGKRISLYGMERLRALILDLAVRGKLVPQDAGDEPAAELLKRIKSANSAGRKQAKKLIRQPFEVPSSWAILSFGELAEDISTGPFGTMLHKEDYVLGGIPLINPSHMIDDRIVEDLSVSLPTSKADELEAYRLQTGDIVFARRGEVGRLALVSKREDGWLCGTGSFRARFSGNELQPYLLKFFRSHTARSFLGGASVGATMANLNQSILSGLPIPLPPLAEQHRIVAKVDELMALCDALERESADAMAAHQALVEALLSTLVSSADAAELATNWARLEQHFDTLFTTEASIEALKQTILDLAVRGKLVEQDAGDEAASIFIKKILAHKGRIERSARQRTEKFAQPANSLQTEVVPNGWALTRFGDIMISRDAERVPISSDDRARRQGEYDYYGASGVIDNIDDYLFDKPLLLIGEDGANLINRSTPIAFIATGKYWVNNHAHVLDAVSFGLLRYMELFINATDLKPYVTGTAQPKMNQAKMNSIRIALPPEAEQQRIVAKVDALMANCDALKARITAAAATQKHLADAITERAAA